MAHNRTTSSTVASKAGKLLATKSTPKAVKSAVASALSQKHGSGGKSKGKK